MTAAIETEFQNPAGRLLAFFRLLQEPQDQKKARRSARGDVLAAALNCSRSVPLEFYSRLHDLTVQVDDVQEFANESGSDSLYLKSLEKIRSFLTSDHDQAQTAEKIEDAWIITLKHFAKEMDQEAVIPQADLDSILVSIQELTGDIANSDIPRALKKWIRELLAMAENAIRKYAIYGAKGLRRELCKLVGLLSEHYNDLDEQAPETMNRTWSLLQRIGTLAQLAINVPKVVVQAAKLIGCANGDPPTPDLT